MKKKLLTIIGIFMFSAGLVLAQVNGVTRCGTPVPPAGFEDWMQQNIQQLKEQQMLNANAKATIVYTVPVIVHVIHNGEGIGLGTNISSAQINSQIDVMNEDFKRLNADTGNTPGIWKSIAADFEINFCKALIDPSGNPLAEPGIIRLNKNTMGWTVPPYTISYIDATIKPATIWTPFRYMNIWVLNLDNSLLGYAYFPSGSGLVGMSATGSATTDGIVIDYQAFGRTGSVLVAPYNKGRTATHEIGHWLGLRHIWGDGNCFTDYCSDTPVAQTEHFNCFSACSGPPTGCFAFPLDSGRCAGNTTGEMTMNYMDYSDDKCMNLFTNSQKTRAQAAMANGVYRKTLDTSTVCSPLGITSKPTLESYINIYPNPTDGMLNIDVSNFNTPEMMLKVYDMLGQSMSSATVVVGNVANGNYEVDLSAKQNGIYFIEISNGFEKITRKIVLNK